jgi:methylenetetrahydrofolate dehydrogenase (NADP+)/methenyltetrahydrofolate cyclohydrolase
LTEIWKGAPVAAALNEKTRIQCEKLKGQGIFPTLAIVRVGQREDDLSYERGVKKRCEAVGVGVRQYVLDAAATQEEVLGVIQEVNADENVHGCLLFRPLPRPLEENEICAALDRDKDVDGITEESLAGVFTGSGVGFAPCTAQAVVEILDYYGVNLTGKRVTVVGRSLVVGKPAAMLLDRKNATVTMCNSRTQNLPDLCREAEVLVVAMGKRGAIGGACFRPGQIVVDVGIHVNEEGKLCGDVRTDEAQGIAAAITPVPGGVGAVTTAVLVRNVVRSAARKFVLEEDGVL